jgi:hypothetical protein
LTPFCFSAFKRAYSASSSAFSLAAASSACEVDAGFDGGADDPGTAGVAGGGIGFSGPGLFANTSDVWTTVDVGVVDVVLLVPAETDVATSEGLTSALGLAGGVAVAADAKISADDATRYEGRNRNCAAFEYNEDADDRDNDESKRRLKVAVAIRLTNRENIFLCFSCTNIVGCTTDELEASMQCERNEKMLV